MSRKGRKGRKDRKSTELKKSSSVKWENLPQVPWEVDEYNLPEKTIQVGEVAIIHGLKNQPDINEKRCVIVEETKTESGGMRWKVKPLFKDQSITIKPENLMLPGPPYKTHPEYMSLAMLSLKHTSNRREFALGIPPMRRVKARGVTYPDDPIDEQARKLVELLACCYGRMINQTIICGTSANYYGQAVPESSMQLFTMQQLEHVVAVVALSSKCQGDRGGDKECHGWVESTIYALLEGYPHSIQAIFGMMTCTPYMGHLEAEPSSFKNAWKCDKDLDLRKWKLTPSQTHKDYINFMSFCYYLFFNIAQPETYFVEYKKPTELEIVFFRSIEKHPLFPLFLERSFQLVARETMGTPDGEMLGHVVRNVLAYMAGLTDTEHKMVLNFFANNRSPPRDDPRYVRDLLNKKGVTSYEELYEFITELFLCEGCRNGKCSSCGP